MNNLMVIFLILSVFLLGCAHAQSVYDETCNIIQKQGEASCFDRSTLGFCMKVGDEWKAFEAAKCDSRLCCNSKLMGCVIDADCKDEFTTSTTSTERAAPGDVVCVVGNLRKHESDCKKYYYCSRNNWVESECSAGVFNENQMSCAFGTCNDSEA